MNEYWTCIHSVARKKKKTPNELQRDARVVPCLLSKRKLFANTLAINT